MVYSDQLRLLNPALPRRQLLYRYGYAMDPDPVMSCLDLKPAARLIYRAILRLCGRGTSCRASVDQIAAQAGVSARSVQRHVTILTFRELIEVKDTPGAETIFRLLPLPAWLIAGRTPILPEDGELKAAGGTEDGERTPPQGRQLDTPGVTNCQGRGDNLSPHENNNRHEPENQTSLPRLGTQSGTEWADQPAASEREGVGEDLEPVLGKEKAETPTTSQQIVQATCLILGFRPTRVQVAFGIREVATLCAGGFTLPEIGQGARYAAEQGWVRSFAGVKFYLPQALNALSIRKAQGAERKAEESTPCPMRSAPCDSSASRHQAAELSPHRALWEQVLERIEPRISRQSYQTWLDPTFIAEYDGQQAVLDTPSAFFQQWIESHYLVLITSAFEEVLGRSVEVTVCASTGELGDGVASAKSADQTPEGGG